MKSIKNSIAVLLLLSVSISLCFAQGAGMTNGPQTLAELQDTIQKILIATKTPGAAIVMVSGDEVVWLKGLGKADIEKNLDVNKNTMFRLGSVSKLFVALAVLKLQEEGRLNLNDKVRDILPEIEIVNPWEAQYPIRIVNLLEHTSGLNDWSLAELGSNDPKPKTLKESLEYYPKGRVAKFVPGTRVQYSNLAVSIAAYVVEKVSGMPYEEYIATHFFKPMGMEDMTYRLTDKYQATGAKGYDDGNLMPYLHVLYRPSAALTGTPEDLVNMLKFFIHRGKINNVQIISDSSFQRMERMESLHIEHSEVFKGGLINYVVMYKNFVYRGHGGSVPGSNSDFLYLPEYNMGFAVMINGNNQDVIGLLSGLIKEYQTKDLPQGVVVPHKSIHKSTQDLSGYYMAVNYKFDALRFFLKIKSLQKFRHKDDTLYVKKVLGQYPDKFYPNGNKEFVSVNSDQIVIFQTNDPVEGQVIYGSLGMLKKITPFYAYTLLVIFWALIIVPVSVLIFALIGSLIYLFGRKKNKVALWICLWPLVTISAVLAIVIAYVLSIRTTIDAFLQLGNISPVSIFIFIGTICFALSSVWSVYYIAGNRSVKMPRILYYHSVIAAIFNIIFTIYFLSNGLIGLMTWI